MPDLTHSPAFWQLTLYAFAIGCCIGSYLNVVIYRLPLGMTTSEPRRSFCPKCQYQFPVWQNIPILSWILLRAKCAKCRQPISVRYPLVEALTGFLFVMALWRIAGPQLELGLPLDSRSWLYSVLAAWVFIALCVAGSYIDIDHQILPHRITWGGTIAGLIASYAILERFVPGPRWENLLHGLGAAALGFGIIWCIVQLGKLAFGKIKLTFDDPVDWSISQPDGSPEPVFTVCGEDEVWSNIFNRPSDRLHIEATDIVINSEIFSSGKLIIAESSVRLERDGVEARSFDLEGVKSISGQCKLVEQPREAMGMGDANWMACVGAFLGWKAVLFTIFAGSIIGASIALIMILFRRREWAARIPFGPYLAAGALIYLFYGQGILDWYFQLGTGGVTELEAGPY